MPTKSTRAFRTISEASEELDLKPHVLRFWEAKFPDLKPMTRGGGRRFYRPEDVDFLRGLRILLHDEKHKIKDVQKLIKVKGYQSVVELGESAANIRESRPIEQRDLVPERIKPQIVKPAAPLAVKPAPPPAPIPEPTEAEKRVETVVVPLTPRSEPVSSPQVSQPAAVVPNPVPQSPAPAVNPVDTADLENALDRLAGLRSRWKKFT